MATEQLQLQPESSLKVKIFASQQYKYHLIKFMTCVHSITNNADERGHDDAQNTVRSARTKAVVCSNDDDLLKSSSTGTRSTTYEWMP